MRFGILTRCTPHTEHAFLTGVLISLCLAVPANAAVVISSDATQNMSCSAGICTATAKRAILNVTQLANMLANSDVGIVSGSIAKDIVVQAALSWTSAHKLSFDAFRSIAFIRPVTIAGPGGLAIATSDGSKLGDFSFAKKGLITFWDLTSSLVINGNVYTLENTLAGLSSAILANPSGYYALAKSYDASADGTYASSPIATFGGTLEGLGNTLSGYTVNNPSDSAHVGLISDVSCCAAAIRDLNVRNASVSGNHALAGGLAGYTGGGVLIRGVHISATVTSTAGSAGGIVGSLDGSLEDSSAAGSVTGASSAGGLAGSLSYGAITRSQAAVNVTGSYGTAGGLVGTLFGYSSSHGIFYSSASGSVTGSGSVGGLVGSSEASVLYSYASGPVTATGTGIAGGLIGVAGYWTIGYSYSTGSVTGEPDTTLGGLIGNDGTITVTQCYSTGAISGSGYWVGGFVGLDSGGSGTYSADYWDLDTTGMQHAEGDDTDIQGVFGLRTRRFKSQMPAGFDPKVWTQRSDSNNGYPYLRDNPPPQ